MKILALDTAMAACSVAIAEGDQLLAREWMPLARGHAEKLFDLVSAVEEAARLAVKDMDRLAVTIGPGSPRSGIGPLCFRFPRMRPSNADTFR